jgi:hypothetical protein
MRLVASLRFEMVMARFANRLILCVCGSDIIYCLINSFIYFSCQHEYRNHILYVIGGVCDRSYVNCNLDFV